MTYRGTIRNGVVELEDGNGLPDGTVVRVEPLEEPGDGGGGGRAKLKALAGVIDDLPSDLARNHDHYLHGHPKQ
jgi:hypothetical protein